MIADMLSLTLHFDKIRINGEKTVMSVFAFIQFLWVLFYINFIFTDFVFPSIRVEHSLCLFRFPMLISHFLRLPFLNLQRHFMVYGSSKTEQRRKKKNWSYLKCHKIQLNIIYRNQNWGFHNWFLYNVALINVLWRMTAFSLSYRSFGFISFHFMLSYRHRRLNTWFSVKIPLHLCVNTYIYHFIKRDTNLGIRLWFK